MVALSAWAAQTAGALRQRNFGLVWASIFGAGLAVQMEQIVQAWLVYTLTDSPFLVGLITTARLASNILAPFAGVFADRLPRRVLLAATQFFMGGLALLMAALLAANALQVWHIFAVAAVGGLARLFDMPVGQALAADTLPKARIANGMALTSVGLNLTMVLGPIIGGTLFDLIGPRWAYGLMAGFSLAAGGCALSVRVPAQAAPSRKEPVWKATLEGLRYVGRRQVLLAALLIAAVFNLTAFPFASTLLPIFARTVFASGAAGLGTLTAALGVGSLLGSAALAAFKDPKRPGWLLIGAVAWWHAMMLAFALTANFWLAAAILAATGVARSGSIVLILTLLVQTAPPEFRGRVLGLRVLAIYAHPLGSMVAGGVAGMVGAPLTAVINAVAGVALTGVVVALAPKLRASRSPGR